MKWIGWGILWVGLELLFAATIGRQPSFPSPSWSDCLLIAGTMGVGLSIVFADLHVEQKALNKTAEDRFREGARNGKPFSLFLRPFDVMSKWSMEKPYVMPFFWDQYDRPGNDALERILSDAVARTAPLIGLGVHGSGDFGPGEGGFVDGWRKRVEIAMNDAAYIFVVPAASAGTLWEIGVIRGRSYFHKTVFVMPPSIAPFKFNGDGEYKDLWEAARIACAEEHQMELPPYHEKGGLFLMNETRAIRGKAFKRFEPRDVAKRINSLIQA